MLKKRFLYILSILLIISICSTLSVKADSPIAMDLHYYTNTEILSIKITHGVTDPKYHYVNSVVVKVNGEIVVSEHYYSQPTINLFNYKYKVHANDGDTIEVIAICSLSGSLSEKMVVGKEEPEVLGSFLTAMPATIVATILTGIIILLAYVIQKRELKVVDKEIAYNSLIKNER